MKKIFILLLLILPYGYGCEKGPVGSTGPQGPAGPTVPTYQMTFENGVYPDSGYTGNDVHWVDGSNRNTAPGTGEIRVGTGITTANVQLGLLKSNLFYKIPSNATITSAYLQLATKTTSSLATGTTFVFGIHQMLDPCSPLNCPWDDTATWLYPYAGLGWQPMAGTNTPITINTDYIVNPLDTVTVTASQVNGNEVLLAWNIPVSAANLMAFPQYTADIYGLCLSPEPETTSGPATGYISFWDNTGNNQQKPQVVVNYTVP